ncbi:hypothetical protein GCM10019060_32350 [Novosphingobium pokkalii]|nr:hypothetical protein GCM10019060_32350 [Novosphingobium pokkalii]
MRTAAHAVQLGAATGGSPAYILAGVLLGMFVAPGFLGLAAFVGAGLLFSGITGWCGMASLLRIMPWNRQAAGRG